MTFQSSDKETVTITYKTLQDVGPAPVWPHAPMCQDCPVGTSDPGLLTFPRIYQPSPLAMAVSLLTSSLKVASSHYFLSHCLLNSLHCIFKIYINLVHFPAYLTPPMGLKSWGQRSAILLTSVIPAFSRVRSTESVLNKYVLNEQNE